MPSMISTDNLTLKVTEIFPSIQGEGLNVGTWSLFIRLSGCNLRCSFCDTEYAWHEGEPLTVGELLNILKEYSPRTVTWTGGEPMLQQKSIYKVIEGYPALHEIETNGTIFPTKPYLFDLIIVSPKGKIKYDRYLELTNAIFKYPTENPYETIKLVDEIGIEHERVYFMPIILQPQDINHVLREHQKIARFCVKHRVNFSPRLQNLLGWGKGQ